QAIGGILVIVGFYFSWETLQTTRRQNEEAARTTNDQQITERFTRAIDQLGSFAGAAKNLPVRVGGIYDLERVAQSVRNAYETNNTPVRKEAYQREYFRTIALLSSYVRSEFLLKGPPQRPKHES